MPTTAGTSTPRNFLIPIDINRPLETPSGLKDPAAAADMLDAAAEELEKQFGAIDKPWGEFPQAAD